MNKRAVWLLGVGLVLLVLGGVMSLTGGPANADPVVTAACRGRLKDAGADMLAKCGEKAFATAMTATDASSATATISAANSAEVGTNAAAMGLLGLGAVLAIAGIVLSRRS